MARLQITSPRQRIEETLYERVWRISDQGHMYAPSCKANGDVDVSAMHNASLTTLEAIQMGQHPTWVDMGIRSHTHRYTMPAVGTCECGLDVILDYDNGNGINCDCGRIYNLGGQELAPRSQWEENMHEDY